MAQVTYEHGVVVGMKGEQLISFEVDYDIDSSNGDVIIDTFYAEAVIVDASGWRSYEKVPEWLYEILKDDVEDFKYDMVN